MPLYAGVCETDITPPHGVWMCGYALRPTGCVAVHDALKARALALHDGDAIAVIVSMDLLGLDFDLVDRIRGGIAERTGTSPSRVMLTATHTHGGPNTGRLNAMGSRDEAYTDVLVRKLIGAATQAADNLHAASGSVGRAPMQIGVNRRLCGRGVAATRVGRNPAGPVMPWVDALVVRDLRERPFAVLFSHACHPTTLGGENLEITADYCGFACDAVMRELDGAVAMFLQGCAGNINPMPRGTFEHARAHGATLADATLAAVATASPLQGPLRIDEETVELPLQPPGTVEDCERRLAEWETRVDEARRDGDAGRILYAEGLRDYAQFERDAAATPDYRYSQAFTMQRFAIGEAQILAMPAEMFVQYGLDFDRQANGPVLALGYANGVHGYVPTAADYPHGGYEVDAAHRFYGTLMYAPDCERLIRDAAYRLLGVAHPDLTPYNI